jgi:preprotein translocase subunit SecB
MTDENQQAPTQEFAIHRVYVKDVSFESPNSPKVFTQEWRPETNVQVNTQAQQLEPNIYEVELTLTVTSKMAEQTAYLVELKQAGIFQLSGFEQEHLGHLLGSYCPNILFPYARATISGLITGGGFPDMALAPINFDALYAQHLEQLKQQEAQTSGEPTTH